MKANPISFNFDVTGQIEEYVDSKATKIGEYPLGVLVGAIGKILDSSDENFNDTVITLKRVEPVKGNPCPYPALVVAGNEIEIVIAPTWAGECGPKIKYPVGSVVLHDGEEAGTLICKVTEAVIKESKVMLYCECIGGKMIGSCFAIDQEDVIIGEGN